MEMNMVHGEENHPKGTDFIFCKNCKYFYITWDKRFPYGCKALGFKSRALPAAEVRASSGAPCLYFVKKKTG